MNAKVVMATASDDRYSPENVLTTSPKEFWMTTGLYPHDIVFQLQQPAQVRTVRFISTHIRKASIEVSEGPSISNFTKVGEVEVGNMNGQLQREFVEVQFAKPVAFVKFVIESGWHAFISLHNIRIE